MKHSQKPNTKAVALQYDGNNAPTISAKGSGLVAQQIIDKAKSHDIHIHNDPMLLEVLSRLELGDEIPQPLYLAVAKIIAFAYYLQGKHPENFNKDISSNIVTESQLDNPLAVRSNNQSKCQDPTILNKK